MQENVLMAEFRIDFLATCIPVQQRFQLATYDCPQLWHDAFTTHIISTVKLFVCSDFGAEKDERGSSLHLFRHWRRFWNYKSLCFTPTCESVGR